MDRTAAHDIEVVVLQTNYYFIPLGPYVWTLFVVLILNKAISLPQKCPFTYSEEKRNKYANVCDDMCMKIILRKGPNVL